MLHQILVRAVSITLFLSLVCIFCSQAMAKTDDYESFRQDLITFIEIYGDAESELMLDVVVMSSAELEAYYSMFSDPTLFAQANEQADARQVLRQELSSLFLPGLLTHAAASGFPPDYPSGGNYATYTATLPGLGIMLGGPTNRTDASAVGGAWIAFDVLEFTALAAQAVCDAASFPVNIVACAAAGVATAAARADQVVLQQADYQDALIDGAEIEAAYENTLIIIGQENDLNTDLAAHDLNIDTDLAAHDLNIDTDLAAHDLNIDTDLAVHDLNIDTDLITHDTDIKALLANLQGAVDENQRLIKITMSRQLEIIRLLITPSGRRVINADVLTCTGDDCPEYPALQLCPNGSLSWNCKK